MPVALLAAALACMAVSAAPSSSPAVVAGPTTTASPAVSATPATGTWSHAYASYGATPKYPRGFAHFDYVNPDAPKGGTLQLQNPDRRSSFDKFNPYTIKGQSPAGLSTLMLESLAIRSGDEPGTIYGMVAEEMRVAPDKSSVTFRIHPKARFTNGDPVTAEDVKVVFQTLTGKGVAPGVRVRLAGIERATVLDDRTIRFDLKEHTDDAIFAAAGLPVFSRKWVQNNDGSPKKFDDIVQEVPIATGPYTIGEVDMPRRIEFVRDPNYWARDLGVAKGQYNFDRIVYRYYQDNAIAIEAFKAGEFDFLMEYSARRWARQHQGPKWADGRIVKDEFPNGFGMGLQSYVLNTRRPVLSDWRVRKAINLAFDFEAINVYKQYKRTNSVFANTDFAMQGMPGPGELALLEPFRSELPPEVFGPAWVPPRSDTSPNALRENLKQARALLQEAGWKVGEDGIARNAKGEPLEFEFLETGDAPGRAEAVFERNLAKIGIRLKSRLVDFSLFRKRLETYDFDMVMIKIGDFTLPEPADLKSQYGSANADIQGADNYRGVKSRAIDHVLEAMDKAQTMQQLTDAARALDRLLIFGYYQVPDLYGGSNRVSRWDRFGIPKVVPKYYTIATPSDWLQWAITAWWAKDADKNALARK
ncbi:MAG: ABC transporter substrate-binding protein [Burkholderiales bacterium]|nr:ABC transporter substrate-binding protein [Burkholderiales bacterium]